MSRYYYCAECNVELKSTELDDCCCPYCGTEIPECAEAMKESGK